MIKTDYEWIIVGGGAAGISIGEILSRDKKDILILEKNSKLASETTKIFHEWLHTGALFTLNFDNLKTTRYLLGAMDDLLEFYTVFNGMNLFPTESGLLVDSVGWFNKENIQYNFKNHKLNILWNILIARTACISSKIKSHDFLRRQAGGDGSDIKCSLTNIMSNLPKFSGKYTSFTSPDYSLNSITILNELITNYINNGGSYKTNSDVLDIKDMGTHVVVKTTTGNFTSKKVAICSPDVVSRYGYKISKSYAPMFVFEGYPEYQQSFVNLDYNQRNCINLIYKGDQIGLAGGISIANESDVHEYGQFIKNKHLEVVPNLKTLDYYVGIKKELKTGKNDRNYLYHILSLSPNVYGNVLGKYTLMFSLAPEFYRKIYKRNPPKYFETLGITSQNEDISDTQWLIAKKNKEQENGND